MERMQRNQNKGGFIFMNYTGTNLKFSISNQNLVTDKIAEQKMNLFAQNKFFGLESKSNISQ